MVLFLRSEEVSDLLDMPQAIACTKRAFRQQAAGQALSQPPFTLGRGRGALRVTVGALSADGRASIRAGMGRVAAQEPPVALLFDTEREELISILAYPFGTLRVGATVAFAADLLAKPSAARVALLGSGRNALSLLEGVCFVRPVGHIRVYSPNPERRASFSARAAERITARIEAVDTPQRAIQDADIIITATNSHEPALRGAWLKGLPEGVHISSIGRPSELDEDVYLQAELIVVSIKDQERNYFDRNADNVLVRLSEEGKLNWQALPELGTLIDSQATRPLGTTVFRESQGGIGDTILATHVYERARALGRGTELALT